MDHKHFHHALKINEAICYGCSHCMNVCPTEAIRIRRGKAVLYENRCIDCGECYKICPVSAIHIEQDDFSRIKDYKYSIALLPSVFIGQFPKHLSRDQIYSAILKCGFTEIREVELSTGILLNQILEYLTAHADKKPLISSFCPAIIRLIQVKFPSLVDNIILLKPPLDITALFCRKKLVDEGVSPVEIGVFYITPCAAKIAAIKSPVGEDYSVITGVINSDYLYNRVKKILVETNSRESFPENTSNLPEKAIHWSLTRGEADLIPFRSLAVDGVHNVIEFLEKIENEEVGNIDFLELRACDESCAGGALNSANRFLITERLKGMQKQEPGQGKNPDIFHEYEDYLIKRIGIRQIKPRSMMNLDADMAEAMKKMVQSKGLMEILSKADCGVCGAPNCQALANDIVQGEASIRHCIFIQKMREWSGELSPLETLELSKEIWGMEKFN